MYVSSTSLILDRAWANTSASSTPNKILRAVVTYHNIMTEAESQCLKALAVEASKKLTDYILLYHISRKLSRFT